MKSSKSNATALNCNNPQQQGNLHTLSPKFNNFIMNQDPSALYKYNQMVNTPSCPRHNLNYNMNSTNFKSPFESIINYNNNNKHNSNRNSNSHAKAALKKNNFNRTNSNIYDQKFHTHLLSFHLNNKLQSKQDSAKTLNAHNLLTPQHNTNNNHHHYEYQRFSPNKSNEINPNNILISFNTELTNTNNNSNIILNNTNYNEALKEKDKQIAKLQNDLIRSQNIITKLKQEKKKLKSTISIPNILHSHHDNEHSIDKTGPFTNILHKKMLTATKSVNNLINTNSNYKSKRSTNCSFGSYDSNTLNTPKESRRITVSPTSKASSTLHIGAYRSNNMNCTGRRFYSGSLNKHMYIDRERNLMVINNNKLLKLKQRNLKSITNLKTSVKKKSSSSEINGTASLTGTATMTRALSLKSGEYDSISDTNNLNLTCDNLLKRMKSVLERYWRIIRSNS